MSIWFGPGDIAELQAHGRDTLVNHLGIEFLELGPDFLRARMPVDSRTHQPAGLLHGGASAALAETLASEASLLCLDRSRQRCVGLEINANHVRGAQSGFVIGIARPIHLGRSTHVWDVRITDERDKLVCVARMTMAILNMPTKLKGA